MVSEPQDLLGKAGLGALHGRAAGLIILDF